MNGLINHSNQDIAAEDKGQRLIHNAAVKAAVKLLERLFRNFDGKLTMRLWNGISLKPGKGITQDFSQSFILILRNPNILRNIVLGKDPLRLANAYFRGDIDIEGDFFAAVSLKDHLHIIKLSLYNKIAVFISALKPPAHIDARNFSNSPTYNYAVKAHSKIENRHEEALQYVTESSYRIWRLYMAACALEFENGRIGIYQILATKREIGQSSLPLTRKHIYA